MSTTDTRRMPHAGALSLRSDGFRAEFREKRQLLRGLGRSAGFCATLFFA